MDAFRVALPDFSTRSRLARLGLLLLWVWLGWTTPQAPAQVLPGTLDLNQGWAGTAGEDIAGPASPPPKGAASPHLDLPLQWIDLGEERGPSIWLQRKVRIPQSMRRPTSRTALLLTLGGPGHWKVWAGEQLLGEKQGGVLGSEGEEPWLLPLPQETLGFEEDLHLSVQFAPLPYLSRLEARSLTALGSTALLGDLEVLTTRAKLLALQPEGSRLPIAVLVMFTAAVGIYHLQLFGRRRRSREYLWFGLLALDVAAALALKIWGWPALGDYGLYRRLVEALLTLRLPLLLGFFHTYLARPESPPVRHYRHSLGGLAFFVLAAPALSWVLASAPLRWLWELPGWVILAVLLLRQLRFGRREARWVGAGGVMVLVAGVVEWLFHLVQWAPPMPWWIGAFTLFATTMALALSHRFERAHHELDGLRHQLERMVSDRTAELSVANDRLQSEIAERRLAEEAMRMLERAVEQSIDGIVVTDLDGNIRFVNEAWASMHGFDAFEILGRRWRLFHTPVQLQEELEPSLVQVKEEGAFDGEIGHQHKNGGTFPTWMSITLLRDAEQGAVGFVAVGRDITNRRQAEAERDRLKAKVQQSRKLKSLGDLAAGIAHDYNNLLTGVLGNSNLLLRALPAKTPAIEKIHQIEGAAERAVELTSQLLAYAGEDPLVLETVEIEGVLLDLHPQLVRLVEPSGHLDLDLAAEAPPIRADPAQLKRAVRSLVANAAEALQGSGLVRVSTRVLDLQRSDLAGAFLEEGHPEGPYLSIAVEDSGCGIDEATRARIFDPFFSTRPSARGLGLAMVLGTMRLHRGVIRLETEPGHGTKVELLLPLFEKPPEASATRRATLTDWRGHGTILVVDDEAVMREVSESILEQHGFEILTAADGPQAVDHYRRHRDAIRLVLLDRTMPGMDGKQVLREIRSVNPQAKVLLMSGYKAKEVLRGLEESEIVGFLQKPFRPDELVRRVYEILGGEDDD